MLFWIPDLFSAMSKNSPFWPSVSLVSWLPDLLITNMAFLWTHVSCLMFLGLKRLWTWPRRGYRRYRSSQYCIVLYCIFRTLSVPLTDGDNNWKTGNCMISHPSRALRTVISMQLPWTGSGNGNESEISSLQQQPSCLQQQPAVVTTIWSAYMIRQYEYGLWITFFQFVSHKKYLFRLQKILPFKSLNRTRLHNFDTLTSHISGQGACLGTHTSPARDRLTLQDLLSFCNVPVFSDQRTIDSSCARDAWRQDLIAIRKLRPVQAPK